MRIGVAICTVGRPEILAITLQVLEKQTERPSEILLVCSCEEDLPEEWHSGRLENVRALLCEKGLTRQRNCALDELRDRCDVVFFIDDDYLPANSAIATLAKVFDAHRDVTGVTGTLLADGIGVGGMPSEEAVEMLRVFEAKDPCAQVGQNVEDVLSLYGCNMAFRMSGIGDVRFDENLPLYGWQEDVDFSLRIRGRKIKSSMLVGIHLGTTKGREIAGRRLGYSQVTNLWYLWRKGSLPGKYAVKQVLKNVAANLWYVFRPEPWIDRKARLLGNCLGIGDILLRRAHPTRAQMFGSE